MQRVDKLTVHVVVDNITDMLSTRPKHVASELRVLMAAGMTELAGEAYISPPVGLCLGGHGAVGTVKPAPCSSMRARTLIYQSAKWPAHALDFGRIEALVLSHGHFDHSEGLVKALELIRGANRQAGPAPCASRGLCQTGPAAAQRRTPSVPGCAAAARARRAGRPRVVASAEAEEILDGLFYLSGEIPRRSFEHGWKTHFKRTADGNWEPDPWIMDERFLATHVQGKGIAIFTGCSHAGVVNICRHAQEVFPDVPLYALVGGLHLVAPNDDIIPETIAALRPFGLRVIIPGHCTGWHPSTR